MMTRKDYRAIGKAIRDGILTQTSSPVIHANVGNVMLHVALYVANMFAQDNPRFDRERFLRFVETGNDSARSLSQTKRGG